MKFVDLYRLVCEADNITVSKNRYRGNAYQLLSSVGIYPNKQYNFYDQIKQWYEQNTDLTPQEIENTLIAKEKAAIKDTNPFFSPLQKFSKNVVLTSPKSFYTDLLKDYGEDIHELMAAYDYAHNKIYINPDVVFKNLEEVIQTILHELVHTVQKVGDPWNMKGLKNKNQNLFEPDKKVYTYDEDPLVKNPDVSYYTRIDELDTILAEVNRVIAKVKNITIPPNNLSVAENELRWVIDSKNSLKIPNEFKNSMNYLRSIIKGEDKDVPNSLEEQDWLIMNMAQRLSLLAKNNRSSIKQYA